MDICRSDTAGPALRGFRLQILYTLARLTEPQTTLQATLFWLEGIEDLAVFDDQGVLREAIQVKGYTAPLTLSELVSRSGSGFLQRAVATAREHPACKIRLLSFGPFGQELQEAWNGVSAARNRVSKKLNDAGLSPPEVSLLFERMTLEHVDEDAELAKIERFLCAVHALGGQSSHAAAILSQWLYVAAERRERISQADLIARLAHVGRYLHNRDGYWRDWFSVIDPLDTDLDVASQQERLGNQFRQGMSTRYEHILARCDVPRRCWLDRISAGFEKASVVIIHGASGQGKSALAYRWLKDETPDLWRLEVRLVDTRRDALQIAATLSSHARAVGAPLTIYLDVRPRDTAWADFVQELARLPQIRILITIREEDWRRARLSGASVTFEEIALTLEEAEAREIYPLLHRAGVTAPFLSFDEAWRRFVGSTGAEGPLMEFVYLVTRTETLRERLKQQVDAIRDAALDSQASKVALDLLAIVSFASAFGARIDVTLLREQLPGIDLGRVIERLEKEYLVRPLQEGLQLDGLHPVRSQLLADIVCDNITFAPEALAKRCLDLIAAEDTELFLLHLATRHKDQMPELVRYLDGWQPRTWAGIGGILRALFWWGVRQYVEELLELVREIRSNNGMSWLITLDLDVADLTPQHGTALWKQFDFIPEQQKARLQQFLDRQPPKAMALTPARSWLTSLTTQPPPPVTQGDWSAISELSYWAGRWCIGGPIDEWLRAVELVRILEQLPLQQVSDLLRGRWELDKEKMAPWLAENRERIAARFRKETDTCWIEDQDGIVRARFLVSWKTIVADDTCSSKDDANHKDRLHAEAIRRIELMRGLFPDRRGYGCQGYGHKFLPMPYDATTKTSIKSEFLPPSWAVRVNGFVSKLIEWEFRLAEWTDYVSEVFSNRQDITAVTLDLRRALASHFRSKHKKEMLGTRLNTDAWEGLKSKLDQGVPLPRQAVDEWGFVSEGFETDVQNNARRIEQGFALTAYRSFLKNQSALFTSISNFLGQALPYLYLHCANGKAGIELSRPLLEAKIKESGGNLVRPSLVFHNLADAVSVLPRFQRDFRRLFGNRVPPNELDEQERQEKKTFDAVLPLLNAYLAQPTAHWEEPERRAMATMWYAVDQIPQRLTAALVPLESEGIRAKILKRADTWESAPALWISLDSNEPLHVFTAPSLAKPLLRRGLLDANLDDEQTRTLPRRWEQVVLVPLFRGRAVDQQAWLVPIYRLTNQDESSEFEWLDQVPQPANHDTWKQADLRCWNSSEMESAKNLLSAIAHFKILMTHLAGFLELAKTDKADREALQAYLDRHQSEWSGIIQALIDGLATSFDKFNQLTDEVRDVRPFLAEAITSTCAHFREWLPPGFDEGEVILSINACTNWLEGATASIEVLDLVGAGLLLDSLAEAAAISMAEASGTV